MKQHEAVAQAMRQNGGYATLGQLNQTVLKVSGCHWGTKTPFASIRRIVQQYPDLFFKIRPGLWALASERERILQQFAVAEDAPAAKVEEFNHSYYQGLVVEIGNLRNYQTFVPNQDKNKPFLSRKLVEVSTLQQFHEFTYDHLLRRARTIDVTWFNERMFPTGFFEIEHSTDIQNSLLKFLEFLDFRIKFHIVADTARQHEYEDKMSRTAFKPLTGLVEFWNYEKLSRLHEKESELSALRQGI